MMLDDSVTLPEYDQMQRRGRQQEINWQSSVEARLKIYEKQIDGLNVMISNLQYCVEELYSFHGICFSSKEEEKE